MDTEPSRNILKINYIPIRRSVQDMAEALIETGYAPDLRYKEELPVDAILRG